MRIFKYPLEPDRRQIVMMPRTAKPLSVHEQNGALVMYAELDEVWDQRPVPRIFVVVTTGDIYEGDDKEYIGTCILGRDSAWFVAHVFEQTSKDADPVDLRSASDFASIKAELSSSPKE